MTAILLLIVTSVVSPLVTAPQVEGVVAGAPKEVRSVESALRSSLGRQGVALVLTTSDRIGPDQVTGGAGGSENVVARFRLDLTSSSSARLYLLDGERRRVYVRVLSLPRGLDPVAIELIRFVVESSVEAIRAGRAIGVSREEYEKSVARPQAPSPVQPSVRPVLPSPRPPASDLVAAVKYESTLMARGRYQHGPGISLAVRLPRLWLGVDVLARIPMTIVGDAAEARIYSGALRVTAAIPFMSSRLVWLAAGAGGGIDVTQIRSTSSRPDFEATPPFWATSPFLRLFAAIGRDFGWLSTAFVVGLDVDLLGERYVVAEVSGKQDVLVPERARPLAAILIGVRR
jgi:hypothetical protein